VQAIGFSRRGFSLFEGPACLRNSRRPRASRRRGIAVPAGFRGNRRSAKRAVYFRSRLPVAGRLIGRTPLENFFDPAPQPLPRPLHVGRHRRVSLRLRRKKNFCHGNEILFRGGMLTTVQDLGRSGHRAGWGSGPGGAMDPFALRVANLLVGKCAGGGPGLESDVLVGPEIVFPPVTA